MMSRLFKLRRHIISNIQFEKNKRERVGKALQLITEESRIPNINSTDWCAKFANFESSTCKIQMNNYRIKTVHILCNNISIFINSTTKCIIWITNWSKKNAKKQWVKHAYRWYSFTQLHKKINRRLKLLRFILLN